NSDEAVPPPCGPVAADVQDSFRIAQYQSGITAAGQQFSRRRGHRLRLPSEYGRCPDTLRPRSAAGAVLRRGGRPTALRPSRRRTAGGAAVAEPTDPPARTAIE